MANYISENARKVTTTMLTEMKKQGQRISMLTAYDYTMGCLVDRAGIDMILIGDSASNVMAGNETTLPITLDQMIYHARSVARAAKHALVVCDMPFGSYQISEEDGIRNAVRIMKEAGVDGVKLEGGAEIAPMVSKIVAAGIPVCGHLGLTPQSVHQFGGYGLRAKEEAEAEKLIADAKALEAAGCFSIVLEKIPANLAEKVSAIIKCPIIGIGAGNKCDGQVLVYADMLGMNKGFKPKFLRQYANLYEIMTDAIGRCVQDVKSSDFPNESESY